MGLDLKSRDELIGNMTKIICNDFGSFLENIHFLVFIIAFHDDLELATAIENKILKKTNFLC